MTEQEAIEVLKDFNKQVSAKADGAYQSTIGEMACEVAISALEEIQQYKLLGTVEELKEAREKQIAKKPKKMEYKPLVDFGWEYACPSCGCAVGKNQHDDGEFTDKDDFCASCGQKLDWSEI